jgi:hypothetical protein
MSRVLVTAVALALCITDASAGFGEKPDIAVEYCISKSDTLKYYISKSDTVVEAIAQKCDGGAVDAVGMRYYRCDMAILKVIKGEVNATEPLFVTVPRWYKNSVGPTPGARYILFLKDDKLADMWFGIQPYDDLMAGVLDRLVVKQKEEAPTKPSTATE